MTRKFAFVAGLLLLAALAAGCAGPAAATPTAGLPADTPETGSTPTGEPRGGAVEDYDSLVEALTGAGATVEEAGEVEQPFFDVSGRIIKVNDADVQVFEFEDEAAAQAAADLVGSDGIVFDTIIVDWIATPHFYRSGRIIVLYVGEDAGVQQLLEAALGAPFAEGSAEARPTP